MGEMKILRPTTKLRDKERKILLCLNKDEISRLIIQIYLLEEIF